MTERKECWMVEDAKTGQLMQIAWKKPSNLILTNPAFKVRLFSEAASQVPYEKLIIGGSAAAPHLVLKAIGPRRAGKSRLLIDILDHLENHPRWNERIILLDVIGNGAMSQDTITPRHNEGEAHGGNDTQAPGARG